jgi:hypothetical protein
MNGHSNGFRRALRPAILLTACLALAPAVFAGETRVWSQGEFADFERGVMKNLSSRSDGVLTLAPRTRELLDGASAAYFWALARDSKGTLYSGGAGAKLWAIPAEGKPRVAAEFEALEIHAIAVDSQDRVYIATSPDGKVYRIAGNTAPTLFYDPKAKYIWALAFDHKGNLYIATGDRGEIHRVAPDGSGSLFFQTDETHARSLAVDAQDNLIVGTEPGGIVLRVSPSGEGFVLYQTAKREVTAVAVAPDGMLYAAAVGNKGATLIPAPQSSQPAAAPSTPPVVSDPRVTPAPPVRSATTSTAPAGPATITGGSEVYRIDPNGAPRRVWSHARDVVYALAFDPAGHLILGAGNKGSLYRVESPTVYTALVSVPSTQVTAFAAGRDGRLYAATANLGKVYEIGPAFEPEGTIESDVLDASIYSLWGRVSFQGELHGGSVAVATRSGNVDSPQRNWSPWSAAITNTKGERCASPAARFIQWKATLKPAADGASPELESVDVAYLPKNLEPRVDEIDMTPPNYRFPPSIAPLLQPQQNLSLPPLGTHAPGQASAGIQETSTTNTPSMQPAKGYVGARWVATDPNGDAMVYTVEIRGAAEKEWKPLRDKVQEKYVSWDSTAFPDGEYTLRVTASDAPGNPPSEALKGSLESYPFVIDNTPTRITGLTGARRNGKLEIRWHAVDALNGITKAEYSLDGGEWLVAASTGKLSDGPELDYLLTLDAPAGERTIAVRVRDEYDNEAVEKTVVK